jgi:nitrile hydratase subunit beta
MAALSDLGGRREYFGAIEREPDEPVFDEDWEGRVFGVAFFVETALGPPNLDAGRFNMEQLTPEDYHASYYHRWFGGLERKLTAAGYLGKEGHDTKRGARLRRAVASTLLRRMLRPTLPRWMCAHVLPRMLGGARPTWRRPRFAVGDSIRVRSTQATGHTRQPGYVTGKPGTITAHHGAALLADAHAVGRRETAHLYTVEFDGTDLWGDEAEPGTDVRIELFETYLEPA